MSNYNIQHYQFFNSTSDEYENSENPTENTHDDINIFQSYIHRNEINQNLPNNPRFNTQLDVTHSFPMNPNLNLPWSPSLDLRHLLQEFENKILFEYPNIPCAHCSILMMKSNTKWIHYDEN
ncbi:4022_t:CDS:1 [Entrophospora sp. SA101]|nr:4022_t:CDS:1 [Entrophospora sp. SA101]